MNDDFDRDIKLTHPLNQARSLKPSLIKNPVLDNILLPANKRHLTNDATSSRKVTPMISTTSTKKYHGTKADLLEVIEKLEKENKSLNNKNQLAQQMQSKSDHGDISGHKRPLSHDGSLSVPFIKISDKVSLAQANLLNTQQLVLENQDRIDSRCKLIKTLHQIQIERDTLREHQNEMRLIHLKETQDRFDLQQAKTFEQQRLVDLNQQAQVIYTFQSI